MGAAVLRLAIAIERLVADTREGSPGEGSRAQTDLSSPVNRDTSDGSTHIAHAHGAARTACLAGADHLRAFVIGVRAGRTTVSNWTVARGAIEAFARAKYLLEADDASELIGRSVAFIREEMKYAAKFGRVATRDGGVLDVSDYLDNLSAMLDELGVTAPQAPGRTKLTSDLIEEIAPGSGGRMRYSQLSAVAHAESAGVQMFVSPTHGKLALSRLLVVDTAHVQIACAIALGDRLLEYFVPGDAAADRWAGVRNTALALTWRYAGAGIDEHGRPVFPGEAGGHTD